MIDINHAQELIGSEVYDPKGDKIGKVGSVYVNDETRKPEWVTVRTGLFGTKETFVPLSGAAATEEGVRVPVSRDKVKDAPQVDAEGGHMSEQEGRDLYSYYGLTPTARKGQAGQGQAGQGQAGQGQSGQGQAGQGQGGQGGMADTGTAQQPMADTAQSGTAQSGSGGQSGSGSGGMTGAETAGAMGLAGAGAGAAGMAARSRSGERTTERPSEHTTEKSGMADTSSARTGSDMGTQSRTATPQHAAETTSSTPTPTQGFTGQSAASTPATSRSGQQGAESGVHSMTRSEEHLRVGTERVESGHVRLRKYVVTEEEQVRVSLSHEEVRIERRPIAEHERSSAMHGAQIGEQSRDITLHAERPVVTKETVPVETVQMRTEMVTSDQVVKGEVRKERIDVEDGSHQGTGQHGGTSGGGMSGGSASGGGAQSAQHQKPRTY